MDTNRSFNLGPVGTLSLLHDQIRVPERPSRK